MRTTLIAIAVAFVCSLSPVTCADQISDMVAQATVAEYQSYLRILTGVDPVPGDPPVYLTNRYSYGTDIRIAGQWIEDNLAAWGLVATEQIFNASYGPNIIGELPGLTRPQDIYIICAHYDTYVANNQNNAPGCDDDGSGTAGVLLAARVLAQYRFAGTLRFVTFAGEEQWMVGSLAYARACRAAGENIVGAINLDMILHPWFDNHPTQPDYDCDFETDPNSEPFAQYVAGQFAAYTPLDFQVLVDADNVSDHWAFWQVGYHAFGLAENTTQEIWGGSNSNYHTTHDVMTAEHYDYPFATNVVRGAMAGLIGLAEVALNRPGDLNCDGVISFGDVNAFVLALSDPAGYAAQYPTCEFANRDLNGDGLFNFDDINPFVEVLAGN